MSHFCTKGIINLLKCYVSKFGKKPCGVFRSMTGVFNKAATCLNSASHCQVPSCSQNQINPFLILSEPRGTCFNSCEPFCVLAQTLKNSDSRYKQVRTWLQVKTQQMVHECRLQYALLLLVWMQLIHEINHFVIIRAWSLHDFMYHQKTKSISVDVNVSNPNVLSQFFFE